MNRATKTRLGRILACASFAAAEFAHAGGAGQIYSLAWGPVLAVGGYKETRLKDGPVLKGNAEAVRALAFSSDGKLLATAGGLPARKGEVLIWDLATQKVKLTISGHSDCIYAVAFAPDGKSIATAGYDKVVKLWDTESGKELRTLRDHIDAIYALAFTPDGKRIVTGAADRSVKIWDAASGERLYTLSESTDGVNTLALSPDGKRVAAAGLDKTIRIWALGDKEGTLRNTLIAHEDAILRLAWSADGEWLASASADHSIKIYRAANLTEVRAITKVPDWAFGLQFAPDGKSLAAGYFNGQLEIYPR
jgi:WD40 repeat protein